MGSKIDWILEIALGEASSGLTRYWLGSEFGCCGGGGTTHSVGGC